MTKTATTTFKGVELAKVGHWLSGRGAATVTQAHLEGAVAAYADREVDRGAIKIGHEGALALGDAHPAAGWVENLRLSADKQTLIGDLAHIPTKLAAIIPRAFRRRSVEMSVGVTTPSGKSYAAALTALSLLGAKAPAVKGLNDIAELYASGDSTAEETIELSYDDTASVPQGTPDNGESETVESNTNERTADVAFTDALKAKLGLAADATDEQVTAALEAATITPAAAPAEGAAPAAPAEGAAAPAAAPAAPAAAAAPAAPAAPAAAPAAGQTQLSAAPGVVAVSEVVLSGMTDRLATLEAEAAERARKDVIVLALSSGRIAPTEQKAWEEQLKRDHEGTAALINTLQPRFSTIELGGEDPAVAKSAQDAEDALLKLAEEKGI
ncbi:head maturation protease [Arthrobacter phage Brent]|uniref:Scaffolding protein n=3 Tax=Jawnskivirus TaxID=3425003 RepID=A0A222Z233_9CAUD|nr:head maturation protease [Arthrobacter phage Brent]ALF01217.1 scaffolding protein [Arthrobacter phage Brent]ASR78114.1 scaffolding protein [Arthrobacter phage Franzy]QNJ59576.1 scaffolding protein [Arthrobacter phage King2]